MRIGVVAVVFTLVAGVPGVAAADDPARACAAMLGTTIPAGRIGTPGMLRAPATVTGAVYQQAADAVLTDDLRPVRNAGNSTAVRTPAKPAFCQLTGAIAPVTAGAQPIGFQVNLPTAWNGSSVQFGGGGFNGVLVDSTGYISIDANAATVRTPLLRGYLTVSTDSGHLVTASPRYDSPNPVDRADANFDFALNPEMFRNFATDAYKKVHDVGEELARSYYGRRPANRLWVGGSEGGREGLLMAQRFPRDIDGVFVRVPVIGWTGLFSNFVATLQAVERDGKAGAFTSADIDLLGRISAQACDAADGIPDAVLSNYLGCQDRVLAAAQCCFTPARLAVLDTVFRRLELGFTLPSGLDHYPGFLVGGEPWSLATKIGNDPTLDYGDAAYPRFAGYGVGAAKYVFAQDPNLDVVNGFDRLEHRDRMSAVSTMMDTLDPDLSAFHRRGGKLVVLECTADYAQSAAMGMEYHDSVVARMGRRAVEQFLRLYVSPGTDHGCAGTIDPATLQHGVTPYGVATSTGTAQGVPRNVDWFGVLENWTLRGRAPDPAVIATTNHYAPPFPVLASKPICAYPRYPHYVTGDPASATSYRCRA